MPLIAVTGSTGRIGSRVARALSAAGTPVRLVGRDPARFPTLAGATAAAGAAYADTTAMTSALRGVHTLFLVSAAESADRVREHRSAIDAAVTAGVQRIVYTSFLGAAADCTFTFGRDHFHTEAALAASGLRWTALRDAFYQDVLPSFVVDPGVLRGPAGDGALAAVAVDDVAEVAVTVLLDGTTTHDGQRHDLSGPAALTLDEVAAALTEHSGRTVGYERETPAQAYASRAHLGAAPFEVDGWVSTYTAVASGEMAPVTGTVERLTGHPATSLRTTLERYPELLDGLRG
jgi:NAD(P)H dehydrogenase (quinone)